MVKKNFFKFFFQNGKNIFFFKKTREENDFLAKIFLVPTAVVGDFFIKIVKKKFSERLEIFGNGQKLVSTAVVEVVEIWN